MRFPILVALASLVFAASANAQGLLLPRDHNVRPLAMVNHRVDVQLQDQVAVTKLQQTFRNHTSRVLEATYVFPVPSGASVTDFSMFVGGKKVEGELLDSKRAKQIYTDIVRRTKDPGLLEYIDSNLFRMSVFPVPAHGDQKIELSYTSIANRDQNLVEYVYPVKTDGKLNRTLEDFTMKLTIKSQQSISSVYSPTHSISVSRPGTREAIVGFEQNQSLLDKDFQLYYALSSQDVGLTSLFQRPSVKEDGYFLMMLSPRRDMAEEEYVPRDMVFVVDTSGSMMQQGKIEQAKNALNFCLDGLRSQDRFAVLKFSTTVDRFVDGWSDVNEENCSEAKNWIRKMSATGGTAINEALLSALDLQASKSDRTFTLVFITDGLPTIGESNIHKILENVEARNTLNTRIFAFGVGDDVNAALLDRLSENTSGMATYVRPGEDLEVKVSSFFSKISHPILANLNLKTSKGIRLSEMFPPKLPDLFHGGQLIVMGRYHGTGNAALSLSGKIGGDTREFVYELEFPEQDASRPFVEDLWARRKVGYLLDQIRTNGESKELVSEVTALAKRYGIVTPYTSYLVVPDAPIPVAGGPLSEEDSRIRAEVLTESFDKPLLRFAQEVKKKEEGGKRARADLQDAELKRAAKNYKPESVVGKRAVKAAKSIRLNRDANAALKGNRLSAVQGRKLGVDLAQQMQLMKNQAQVQFAAQRRIAGRDVLEIGGAWIDQGFRRDQKSVVVKAQSEAYFRILELQPTVREVFKLGNHIVWVTPSGVALVVDTKEGKEQLPDKEINDLFVARR